MAKIYIYSRRQIQRLLPSSKSILISITDPGRDYPKVTGGWRSLQLRFHDIDEVREKGDVIINDWHAVNILKYLDMTQPEEIAINCEAGISRSAGVAVALEEILNGNNKAYKKYPNHNRRVASTILRVWHERFSGN
jgi:predicted protein tyrosine phosphatase